MTPLVTAGAGFLLAVLWFDLMFDVQVLRHREHDLPEGTLSSIAAYYRRVTTAARPMNLLIGAVMAGTLGAIVAQIAADDAPAWATWASLALTGSAVALAALHTYPAAVRLGDRSDSLETQSRLARSICRDHLLCLVAIGSVLVLQLAFAG
jgi:ER membrane protein SH3